MVGLSLERGLLIVWAVLLVSTGLAWMIAPERALRWTYRWQDRMTRWITFGRLKKAFGPLMRDATAVRIMRWVGPVLVTVGVAVLMWLLFNGSD